MSLLKKLRNKKLQKAVLSSVLVLSLGFWGNGKVFAYQAGTGAQALNGSTAVGDNAKSYMEGVAVGTDSEAGLHGVAIGDSSLADFNAVSIGINSKTKEHAVAIGREADAGIESVAIGYNAIAANFYSTAIGYSANAGVRNTVAVGRNSSVIGEYSVGLGVFTNVTGQHAVSIGDHSKADEDYTVSFGSNDIDEGFTRRLINVSSGINQTDAANVSQLISSGNYDNNTKKLTLSSNSGSDVIVDLSALSTGGMDTSNLIMYNPENGSIGRGPDNNEDAKDSIILGNNNTLPGVAGFEEYAGQDIVILGNNNNVGTTGLHSSDNSIILGNNNLLSGNMEGSLLIGNSNQAGGSSLLIGDNNSGNTMSVAIGRDSTADSQSIVIGIDSVVGREEDTTRTVGEESESIGIGNWVKVTGMQGVGLGTNSTVEGWGGTALGYHTSVTGDGAVAIGMDSVANEDYTVSFGSTGNERRLVNVAAGVNLTDGVNVSQLNAVKESITNSKNEAVNSSNSYTNTIIEGVNSDIAGKANADASNVAGHTAEWGAAIGTGVVEEGNGELVTGGTVYNVVKDKADITYVDTQLGTKADIDLGNITVDGQNVIKNIAKGSVKLENGINTTVSSTENDDGSLSYKVNVEGTGVAEEGNTGLVSGDTLYNTVNNITNNFDTELEGKANADASNVADHTAEWGAAIGTGVVEEGNSELVTGDTVYDAVKDKADKNYVDEQLNGKADADLGNLTDEGKDVIKDIAKDTVKVEDGLNTTVSSTENADGSISYQVNVEGNGKAEAGNTGLINGDTLYNTVNNITNNFNTELEGKANADASNVADHSAEWGAAIGTGVVDEGYGDLVTGGTVYDAVKDKVDSDLGNLTDDGKNVIGDIAKDALQDDLDGKANIDASNIETDKWADKLGTGTISAGDNNLVTGNTVYDAIKDLGSNSLVTSDGNTISVGKNDSATVIDVSKHNSDGSTENRVITGIETDASDMSSAANVGYVNNSVSQMANEFNRGLSELDSRMKKGVAGAAALAALNPLDYDPENKLNFAAGVGSYKGESAAALGMFYRPNENIMFSLGGAFGNGENMWNAGITFNLDKPNASTSKAAMARAIKTMAANNEALEAKAAEQDEKIALLTAQVEALMAAQKK